MRSAGRSTDPQFVQFARRVGVVLGALLALLAFSRVIVTFATSDIRGAIEAESRARVEADTTGAHQRQLTDQRLERMAAIMELVVLVVAEQADPAERKEAIHRLRGMRRVAP